MTHLLRTAGLADLLDILRLARHLDSPNLPADEEFLKARLERSERSFAHPGPPGFEHEYQLAVEDESGQVVGTSVILSKHGTPGMPHVFLRVRLEERRASKGGPCVRHRVLQLGASEDGPTEIGALVLLPESRGKPDSPGKLLSWGRFAYMARHPESFERQVLAEMRAPLDAPGKSVFWDAFGRHFTGMTYAEADRRSAQDKSFILDLFPTVPFYATVLPPDVSEKLGQVHPDAQPAMRLLEKAGLYWIGEIDPLDAGPFIGANVSEVVPIRETARGILASERLSDVAAHDERRFIAATEEGGRFRAVVTPAGWDDIEVRLPEAAAARLTLPAGGELSLTPLPPSSRRSDVSEGDRG